MSNIRISQLPTGSALTGTELVPVVQNGQTIQTTVSAFTSSPSLTQTFLTVNNEPTLPNSRYLGVGTGLGLTDTGAQGQLRIVFNGTAASLETAGIGFIAKTASNTVAGRTFQYNSGLSITNADGVSGNPTFSVTGLLSALAATTGTGLLATAGGATLTPTSVLGVANQISVSNGDTQPLIGLASNPTLPGNAGTVLPSGNTSQRSGSPTNGTLRYNTDIALLEAYLNGVWTSLASGSGVTSIATGTGLTGGPITSTGTISIDNTGVTAGSYTAANITVNAQGQITVASSNNSLVNSFSAGTTGFTPSTATTGAVTLAGILNPANGGTGAGSLTGYVYGNGTGAMTAATTIPNSGLTNSSVTVGTTTIALGATSLTLGGLTSVAVTADPTTALQLATKQYVDGLVSSGLAYHQPVQAATTQSLAAQTGGTVTYNNGTGGVGATITLSVALTTLDGYSLSNTNRILVKDEVNGAYNGVYTWATGGTVLTRSTDTNSYGPGTSQLSEGDYFFVQNGTVNKGSSYVCSNVGTITFGTTAITFSQFSTSQVYTGTSPIQITGTVISLNTVPVASGGTNITSYSVGDLLYASGSTTLSKLTIGTANYVLTSSGTAPQYVAQSTLSVGSATTATTATNATNTAITANSTNATNYLTFVSATTGNLGQLVNSSITCNPSTGALTGGISGGTF
jgi:hypothetical protein